MKGLNCPNCGAPITGDKCEYCGTVFRFQEKKNDDVILYADGVEFARSEAKEITEKKIRIASKLLEMGISINAARKMVGLPPIE